MLTQADAILHYLARLHPAADLLADGTAEGEAELDRWGCFLTGDLHPAFFPLFVPQRYTTATDPASLKAVSEAGEALVASRITLLEEHLRGREWMTGGKRTILDAYALPMLNWAEAKLPDGLTDYPCTRALHRRMLADRVVQSIMQEEKAAPVAIG